MIIYRITNKINNKVYIGQTIRDIKIRWQQHCKSNRCSAISNAIQKYGKENFLVEEIDGANSLSELNYLEQHHIHMHNSLVPNGYNLMTGGRNSSPSSETREKLSKVGKGKKRSEEQKLKMSLRIVSQETKDKISQSNSQKKRTQKMKDHLSEINTGKKLSEETCKKISLAQLGEKHHYFNKNLSIEHVNKIKRSWNNREMGKSGYRGVYYRKDRDTWIACIIINKKSKILGSFHTPEEAALAYNNGAIKYHGEFAYLNKIILDNTKIERYTKYMKIEGQFLPTKVLQDAVDQLRKLPFAEVADLLGAIGKEHKPVTIEVPDPTPEPVLETSVPLEVTAE